MNLMKGLTANGGDTGAVVLGVLVAISLMDGTED